MGVGMNFVELGRCFVGLAYATVREQGVECMFGHGGHKNEGTVMRSNIWVDYMGFEGKFGYRVETGYIGVMGP